jgi:hypothetical protein
MKELKRETTIAKRRPEASSFPSSAWGISGTGSILNLVFPVISVLSVVKEFERC